MKNISILKKIKRCLRKTNHDKKFNFKKIKFTTDLNYLYVDQLRYEHQYYKKASVFFLLKEFKFENFLNAQDFINKVGAIAETEGHHPDIWFGWGYAKIKIFTHAINGLAESDFILAAKIDKIN